MRIARLLGVILTILTAVLLLAPPAGAQPPFRLPGQVTDNAGLLSDSGRAAVSSAVDKLYADRHIRLWVVYVDNFSGLSAENWAKRTYSTSDLSGYDSLLAVSSTGRAYAFLVPSTVRSVSQSQVDDLRRTQIEPALRAGNWTGAAVADGVLVGAVPPTWTVRLKVLLFVLASGTALPGFTITVSAIDPGWLKVTVTDTTVFAPGAKGCVELPKNC